MPMVKKTTTTESQSPLVQHMQKVHKHVPMSLFFIYYHSDYLAWKQKAILSRKSHVHITPKTINTQF